MADDTARRRRMGGLLPDEVQDMVPVSFQSGLLPDWLAQGQRDAAGNTGAYADGVRPGGRLAGDLVRSGVSATASALDPFNVPSAVVGTVAPKTRDAWRQYQALDPVASLVGGAASGIGAYGAGANAVLKAAPGLLPQIGFGAAASTASDAIDEAAGKPGSVNAGTALKALFGGGSALPLATQAKILGAGAAATGAAAGAGALFPERVAAETTAPKPADGVEPSTYDRVSQGVSDLLSSFRGKDFTPMNKDEFEAQYRAKYPPPPRLKYATEGEAVEAARAARQKGIDPSAVTAGNKALERAAADARDQYRRDRAAYDAEVKAYHEQLPGRINSAYQNHVNALKDAETRSYDKPFAERNPGIATAGTVGAGGLAALLYGRRAGANNATLAAVQQKIAGGPLPTEVAGLLQQEARLANGTAVLPYLGLGAAGAGLAKTAGDITDATVAPPESKAAELARSKWIPYDKQGQFNPEGLIANAKELTLRGGFAAALPGLLKVPLRPSSQADVTAQVRGGKLPDPDVAANDAVRMKELAAIDREFLGEHVPADLQTHVLRASQARNARGVADAAQQPLSETEKTAFRQMIGDRTGRLPPRQEQGLLPTSEASANPMTRSGSVEDLTPLTKSTPDVASAQSAQTLNNPATLSADDAHTALMALLRAKTKRNTEATREVARSDTAFDPRLRPSMPTDATDRVRVGDLMPLGPGDTMPASHQPESRMALNDLIDRLGNSANRNHGFEKTRSTFKGEPAENPAFRAANVLNDEWAATGRLRIPTRELAKRIEGSLAEFDTLKGDKNGRFTPGNRERILHQIMGKGHTLALPMTAGATGAALLRQYGIMPSDDELRY